MTRDGWPLAAAVAWAAGLAWTARVPEAGLWWRLGFVALSLSGALILALAQRSWRPSARLVGIGAVLLRLVLLPLPPTLSDDGYRYVWDGMVLAEEGASPYRWRPSDPALEVHHDEPAYERMNSPHYYSVYPPVTQAVFALGGLGFFGGWYVSWLIIKLVFLSGELVGVWCLLRLVAPHRATLYAWHPLAVVEVAGQGHPEGLVVGLLGLSLLAVWRGRGDAPVWMSLAGWVKLYPFALVPLAARRASTSGWGIAGLIALLGALPFVADDALAHVRESLTLFAGTFDLYSAPYLLLKGGLYPLLGEGAGRLAALLMGLVALGGIALVTVRSRRQVGRGAEVRAVCVGVLLLTLAVPTLHPWYWLGALATVPLLGQIKPLFWLITLGTATYLGYTWSPAFGIITLLGWGGALLFTISLRQVPRILRRE